MAVKIYGSVLCPATQRFIAILTENGVMPQFINVTGSIGLLKEFIQFRDTSPIFQDLRGTGRIGLPLIELEDGRRTLDANEALAELGIEARMDF